MNRLLRRSDRGRWRRYHTNGLSAAPWLLTIAFLAGVGCDDAPDTTLRFWALGREGEVVQGLVRDFESMHPGVRVEVQQIPWSAAHEKLLTAFVGRSTPDLAQLGNTWIAEFAALEALEPLDRWVEASHSLSPSAFFPGIWDTNVIDGTLFAVPWYVDTRLLFYRKDTLAAAGYDEMPTTWAKWREAMRAVKREVGPDRFAIFLPVNEWTPAVVLGLQGGTPLLADRDTRGAFSGPGFRRALDFYLALFDEGLAPPVRNNEVANVYQEFARGYFAMYITGPWNLGEFRHRLPAELSDAWATAPMPGLDETTPGVSLAGGASLGVFRSSEHKALAFELVEFLSEPAQQVRFYREIGDLPAHQAAWNDSSLSQDPQLRAFADQLLNVVPLPKIPEWELIATRVQEKMELAVRGNTPPDSVLALLDRDVWRILEKRRWLLARESEEPSRLSDTP